MELKSIQHLLKFHKKSRSQKGWPQIVDCEDTCLMDIFTNCLESVQAAQCGLEQWSPDPQGHLQ